MFSLVFVGSVFHCWENNLQKVVNHFVFVSVHASIGHLGYCSWGFYPQRNSALPSKATL